MSFNHIWQEETKFVRNFIQSADDDCLHSEYIKLKYKLVKNVIIIIIIRIEYELTKNMDNTKK